MICKDMQPFGIVNNEGYQNLIKTLILQYKIPCRNSFFHLLYSKSEFCSVPIKENQTITTDIWTDKMQTMSSLGITVHFADKNQFIVNNIG